MEEESRRTLGLYTKTIIFFSSEQSEGPRSLYLFKASILHILLLWKRSVQQPRASYCQRKQTALTALGDFRWRLERLSERLTEIYDIVMAGEMMMAGGPVQVKGGSSQIILWTENTHISNLSIIIKERKSIFIKSEVRVVES